VRGSRQGVHRAAALVRRRWCWRRVRSSFALVPAVVVGAAVLLVWYYRELPAVFAAGAVAGGAGSVTFAAASDAIDRRWNRWLCSCPRCARNLWFGSKSHASGLLRGWAVRNGLAVPAAGDDEVVMVRCDRVFGDVFSVEPSTVPKVVGLDERWAAAVLLSWSSWFHGVSQCTGAQERWLRAAAAACGRHIESCERPVDLDELELLVRLASKHPLELSAKLARATMA